MIGRIHCANKDKCSTTWGLILIISHNACTVATKVVQIEVIYDWPTSLLRYICMNWAALGTQVPICRKTYFSLESVNWWYQTKIYQPLSRKHIALAPIKIEELYSRKSLLSKIYLLYFWSLNLRLARTQKKKKRKKSYR